MLTPPTLDLDPIVNQKVGKSQYFLFGVNSEEENIRSFVLPLLMIDDDYMYPQICKLTTG